MLLSFKCYMLVRYAKWLIQICYPTTSRVTITIIIIHKSVDFKEQEDKIGVHLRPYQNNRKNRKINLKSTKSCQVMLQIIALLEAYGFT